MPDRSLSAKLAELITVPAKGGRVTIDSDFLASTLPKDLSADNFHRSIKHVTDLTEATAIALAERSIERAKEDADFDMSDLELKVNDQLTLSSTWHRKSRRARADESGKFDEVYGSILSTATLRTSDKHQETLKQLEDAAANILNL